MEQESENSTQESQTKCMTVLLEDLPSDTDAFGSHERVANAIANLLEEDGGKSIALVGSWGSGKSTVVRLLDSNLSQQDGQKVFIYNAWAHEGDPLRRSFLESLIAFLVSIGWATKKSWKKELDTIRKRRERTKTTSEPVLTWWGKLIAVYAIIVPLGYILFDKISNQNDLLYPSLYGLPIWKVGLIIGILPLILVLLATIMSRILGNKDDALFIQKSREINRSTTIRTPDPTSLEFKHFFNLIMKKTLSDEKRKLIIVIDNLDRIDPSEALSLWSTMRAFFEIENNKNLTWNKQFWLLVPFDPTALKRLWRIENPDINKENKENFEEDINDLVKAFVDKTFQIKFPVPPPMMSAWKQYFLTCLEEAFENHSKDDFNKVYHLYRLIKLKNSPPTPRDIKLFINQIGAFHRIWGDEIPLIYQALYVIYKKQLQSSKKAFIQPDTEDNIKHIYRLAGPDFPKYLAALHFNVEPQKAIQILLEDDIVDALKNGDTNKLKEYSTTKGFQDNCENIIEDRQEDWIEVEQDSIATAAFAFDGLEIETNVKLPEIWKRLGSAFEKVDSFNNLNEKLGKGLNSIFIHCRNGNDEVLVTHILQTITNTTPEWLVSSDTEEDKEKSVKQKVIQAWLNGSLAVQSHLSDSGHDELIKNNFRVPGNANLYLDIMMELSHDKGKNEFVRFFKPLADPQNIVDALAKACEEEGAFDKAYSECVDLMCKTGVSWPWENLLQSLKERLKVQNTLQSDEIIGCVECLSSLTYTASYTEAKEYLEAISTNGLLLHHLHDAKNNSRALAACIFLMLDFNPEGGGPQQPVGNSNQGSTVYRNILENPDSDPDIIKNLAALFINFPKLKELLAKQIEEPNIDEITGLIVEEITKREDAAQQITPKMIIDDFGTIKKYLSEPDLNNLINRSVQQQNLLSELSKEPFDVKHTDLYLSAFENSKEQNQTSFIEFLKEGLSNVSKDVWTEQLKNEGNLVQLILLLIDHKVSLNLSTEYTDALEFNIEHIITGKVRITSPLNKSENLLSVLTEESRKTFLRTLRDKLVEKSSNDVKKLLDYYGDQLINSGVLEEDADDIVRRLFSNIVSRRNKAELEWVQTVIEKRPNIKICESETKGSFRKRLESTLNEVQLTDETRPFIEKIAIEFDVDPTMHRPEPEAEEETTSEEEEETEDNEENNSE